MSEIIKRFISGLDGSDDNINIRDILSDEDILLFEKWVRIFSEMGPFTIVKSIKKIEKKEEEEEKEISEESTEDMEEEKKEEEEDKEDKDFKNLIEAFAYILTT